MTLSLRIALRYLFSPAGHHAVSIISRISVAGIAGATAAIVIVLSVFNGFTDLALSRLSVLDPELRIEPTIGKTINRADSLATLLRAMPEIELAEPTVEERALANYSSVQMPVRIKGVTDAYALVTSIDSAIIDGEFLQAAGDYPCATLSVGTAITLGARPGYTAPLHIYVPRREGRINPAAPMNAFRADTLVVSGVFEIDQPEYDADLAIIPIASARRLLNLSPHQATALELTLADGVNPSRVAERISPVIGSEYTIKTRLMQQATSYKMISIEKWLSFAMLAFILAIASFNVISTMSMLILEKRPDIATLTALGASPKLIKRIFLIESTLISSIGAVIGLIVGVILSLAQQWGGFIRLNGDPGNLSVSAYPVSVSPLDILAILILTIFTGLLTGFIASRFSGRFTHS